MWQIEEVLGAIRFELSRTSGIRATQLKMASFSEITIHEGLEKEKKAPDVGRQSKEKSQDTISYINVRLARLELAFGDKFDQIGELGECTKKLEDNQ